MEIRCKRCGTTFESGSHAARWCAECRIIITRERNRLYDMTKRKPHVIKHEEQPNLASPEKRREHKARAEAVQMNMNEVLKIAEREHLSYGVAVARLRDGKL